jgi:glycosyltransferase involved in cell wall biosynthesis
VISIVINSLGRGGAERSILLLTEELLRRGNPVQIVCLFDLPEEYPVPPALQTCVHRLRARSDWMALVQLRRYLANRRPRVVYALMPQSNLAAWLAGASLRLPVLTSERTTPTLFYRSKLKLLLSMLPHAFSRQAVFISHFALKQGLPTHALGSAVGRNACVLHNPVPSPVPWAEALDSRRARLRRLRSWARGNAAVARPLRLLLASRLVPGKGILEFVETAKELLLGGSMELSVAGAGPLQMQLLNLVESLGVAAQVHLRGFVEDIHAAYASADVVVLSSESEGFGRVGFEAYQAGCLVLGTPHNSFASEILAESPAWQVVPALSPLRTALLALASAAIPDDGEDMAAMREALGIERHTQNFIDIVSRAAPHV